MNPMMMVCNLKLDRADRQGGMGGLGMMNPMMVRFG
jgi:hypothetical protein